MVKIITAQQTYPLRLLVLRPGMPKESVIFNSDEAEGTFHLGYFKDNQLVSVVSFMLVEEENGLAYQLRGMATHPSFVGKGYATELILVAEKIIQALSVSEIWMNARENAVSFYERLGYTVQSDAFMIETVGVHYKMAKTLP